jgi:hypothetical protein
MNRSSRLVLAAAAALVLTGCIPIGIKSQSLPWTAAAPWSTTSPTESAPAAAQGVAAIVAAKASM